MIYIDLQYAALAVHAVPHSHGRANWLTSTWCHSHYLVQQLTLVSWSRLYHCVYLLLYLGFCDTFCCAQPMQQQHLRVCGNLCELHVAAWTSSYAKLMTKSSHAQTRPFTPCALFVGRSAVRLCTSTRCPCMAPGRSCLGQSALSCVLPCAWESKAKLLQRCVQRLGPKDSGQ